MKFKMNVPDSLNVLASMTITSKRAVNLLLQSTVNYKYCSCDNCHEIEIASLNIEFYNALAGQNTIPQSPCYVHFHQNLSRTSRDKNCVAHWKART